jgi:hypothetical protein
MALPKLGNDPQRLDAERSLIVDKCSERGEAATPDGEDQLPVFLTVHTGENDLQERRQIHAHSAPRRRHLGFYACLLAELKERTAFAGEAQELRVNTRVAVTQPQCSRVNATSPLSVVRELRRDWIALARKRPQHAGGNLLSPRHR